MNHIKSLAELGAIKLEISKTDQDYKDPQHFVTIEELHPDTKKASREAV